MNVTIKEKVNKLKNPDFAYWVGVAQSDGYFKRQYVKSKKRVRYYIVLGVGKKSIPMLNKFISLSKVIACKGLHLSSFK